MNAHALERYMHQEKLSNAEVFLFVFFLACLLCEFSDRISHTLFRLVLLQVTSLLLEGERRKLSVLQRELQAALAEGGSIKAKEQQKHELILAIS
jgi:hypothetical protein